MASPSRPTIHAASSVEEHPEEGSANKVVRKQPVKRLEVGGWIRCSPWHAPARFLPRMVTGTMVTASPMLINCRGILRKCQTTHCKLLCKRILAPAVDWTSEPGHWVTLVIKAQCVNLRVGSCQSLAMWAQQTKSLICRLRNRF
jgi:hypothetical protein